MPYRTAVPFILLYDRPAFSPLPHLLKTLLLRAPRCGGENHRELHCTRSAAWPLTRPLARRPGRGVPSSSALICLHSRHIAAVIVSPRSKPASSARVRSASISRLSAAGSLKVIGSCSCLRLRTPISHLSFSPD